MVSGWFWVTFRERGQKGAINDRVYKGCAVTFCGCRRYCFPYGKLRFPHVAEWLAETLLNLMLFDSIFITFWRKAFRTLHKRQVL